jgi:hypothetical protein
MGQALWNMAFLGEQGHLVDEKIIAKMIKVPYYLMRVEGHLQVNGPNTCIFAIFNS